MITQRSTLTNLIALYLTSLLLADADEEKNEEVEDEDEEPSKSDEGISEEPEIEWTQVELANDDYSNDDDEDTYEFMFEDDDEEGSADSTTEVDDENYKPDTNLADKNAEWEAERGSDDEYPFTTYNEDPLKELREYVERDETEDKEENSEDGPQ